VIWWFASSAWSWSLAKSDSFMVFPTLTCNRNLLAVHVKTRLLGGIPHTDLQQPPAATGEHTVGYSSTSITCTVFRFSSQPLETIYAPNQTVKKGDEWRNELAAFFAQDELYLTTA
jgi:hypothetical protein